VPEHPSTVTVSDMAAIFAVQPSIGPVGADKAIGSMYAGGRWLDHSRGAASQFDESADRWVDRSMAGRSTAQAGG
jgi:hypothetical protein